MRKTDRLLRLNPNIEFSFQDSDLVTVTVKRGESLTRYSINKAIHEFLEKFREPASLQQVAMQMSADGFDVGRVIDLGKSIMKTPLIEFYDPDGEGKSDIGPLLRSMGFRLEVAFKHREFCGVFKVRSDDGTVLVLKLLHTPDPSVAESIGKRLRNEYRILRDLEEAPGVMRAHGFVDGPTPYLAVEFVPGIRLHSLESRPLEASLAMCVQVARIVEKIHARGIIHGDLHTSNMLYDKSRNVTVIDFDCSFFMDEDYLPRNGGAIHFLPPERVMDTWCDRVTVKATKPSDIYQAGVAIYNILTGNMPYRGDKLSELAKRIKSGKFRALKVARSGETIPADVVEFVHRALEPDPRDRPASMEEFPDARS